MYFKKVPGIIQKLAPAALWHTDAQAYHLTFDDGPHPESTPLLLNTLDSLQIEASFFCLGRQAQKYPELIEEIRQKGHRIGAHGMDHLSGWSTPNKSYIENVRKAQKLLNTSLFRPPYGRLTPGQYNVIKKEYKIVMWDIMPGDFDASINIDDLINTIQKKSKYGSIIAMHDTPKCIEKIVQVLKKLHVIMHPFERIKNNYT